MEAVASLVGCDASTDGMEIAIVVRGSQQTKSEGECERRR